MAKVKTRIRQKVSQALGILIPEGGWEQKIDEVDRMGWSDKKSLTLLILLCQQVEKIEIYIEDLYFQQELRDEAMVTPSKGREELSPTQLQEFSEAIKSKKAPELPEIRLRTPEDIASEFDKDFKNNPQLAAFYIPPADFKIFAKRIDPTKAKTDPEYGYSKETDPLDGKEKTCMLYKGIPVFQSYATNNA